ncbi:hypothetical protein BLNAU_1585 [Blattamonas nauphoetae]|uniref:Uncharacterized protein n=1 Tax=Blattamonas nauphoetae TaxID=2049346 RepID=A0ABQ9YIF3_9EUKA|nr:hypothetical protein BLNAU_1585 [Blattamonas nauphoetae]
MFLVGVEGDRRKMSDRSQRTRHSPIHTGRTTGATSSSIARVPRSESSLNGTPRRVHPSLNPVSHAILIRRHSDIDEDILSESSILHEEPRRKGSLRVLNLIHEIRSRRIETGDTDWDPTPFIDSGEFDESERVPRDHFDDTIFDLVDQYDIIQHLDKLTSVFVQTGNLNHLTLTPVYLTKLTHFILSETGSFGDTAATHLSLLLSVVPDPSEIVSTVYPLLRNAFHRSNENACSSLLIVVIRELEMKRMHSAILACWTDADWVALFTFRWIRLQSLRHFLGNMLFIITHTHQNRQSPSISSLSLVRLFSTSNNIVPRSERLVRLFTTPEVLDHVADNIISGIVLCHAAQDERLPSSVHDALVHLHITDPSFSTLPLLIIFHPAKSEIGRFLSSFPADVVIEKELSRMLLMFDDQIVEELCIVYDVLACTEPLTFLHPFILRGLGSVLLQLQSSAISTEMSDILELISWNGYLTPALHESIDLFILYPSDQIVEFSIALLLDLSEKSPFSTNDPKEKQAPLKLLTTLASHSVHTASATSLNRWFNTFHRLFLNPSDNSDELPPFAFESLFGEANDEFTNFPRNLNYSVLDRLSFELFKRSLQTAIWSIEDLSSFDERKAGWSNSCRGVLTDLVSPIPALRNVDLVLLTKVCVPANRDEILELCRFGVVECVMRAVEASPSLEEYEMGVSILGSIFRTLSFSRSIDEMTSFDFSTPLEHFWTDSLT